MILGLGAAAFVGTHSSPPSARSDTSVASSSHLNGWMGYRGPTTTTQPPTTVPPVAPKHTVPPRASRSAPHDGSVWDCIAEKESGNGRGSANIYQFLPSTWRSAAKENGSPYATPESAPPAEQRRVAEAWGAKHGIANQWTTGRRCGA